VGVRRARRQGHRLYDWAFIRLDDGDPSPGGQGQRWLLVRRNPKTRELVFYRCWTPRPVPLAMPAHAFLVVAALTDRTRHHRPG
jgi:hypothetical protein